MNIENYEKQINALKQELRIAREEAEINKREMQITKDRLEAIENAFFWKITKPARIIVQTVRQFPRDGNNIATLTKKGLISLRENGIRYTWVKARTKVYTPSYSQWMKTPLFSDAELEKQRNTRFSKDIVFSITVPLYNTPERFLREMIESVQAQTYGGWELCLADGSDEEHSYVGRLCKDYSQKDERIKYRKLEKNLGISGNTNACLEMAEGDFIALFDHDDILHPTALHEMMKAICEKDADIVYTDEATFESPDINKIILIHFKPAFAPDNLRANNYICHFTAFRRKLLDQTGGFRSEYDGSQDHDLMLRLTAVAANIVHIPEVLYYWRAHPQSVAMASDAKDYAMIAGRKAVKDSLESENLNGIVESSRALPSIYRIRYELSEHPKVSIIIPTCDHIDDLSKCILSVEEKTTYENYEIIIVENNSKDPKTFAYYDEIQKEWDNIKVITWSGPFNYSAINNFGAKEASGDYLLLLNNDIEVISTGWIEEMLMYAQREDVGAVGAMLYYPDDTIQHAGVVLGLGGVAGHVFSRQLRGDVGYMGKLCYAQNVTAVTAACLLIKRSTWDEVGGLDEEFAVAFNDVDLCMRLRQAGYLNVWTPFAELYHYESKSRGKEDTPEKKSRFRGEEVRFMAKWNEELSAGDIYFNPNFSLLRADCSIEGHQRRQTYR